MPVRCWHFGQKARRFAHICIGRNNAKAFWPWPRGDADPGGSAANSSLYPVLNSVAPQVFFVREDEGAFRMAVNGTDAARSEANGLVERNIAALLKCREAEERQLTWQDRLADQVSRFASSMLFVWLHAVGFGLWIVINLKLVPGVPSFDPKFVVLALVASIEAIFLSSFMLVTQNRLQTGADRRAELNLQISLLAEHEITRLLKIVTEIGERLDLPSAQHPEVEEMTQDVRPEAVLESLERRTEKPQAG
jgi:uncharacterized membrane protein